MKIYLFFVLERARSSFERSSAHTMFLRRREKKMNNFVWRHAHLGRTKPFSANGWLESKNVLEPHRPTKPATTIYQIELLRISTTSFKFKFMVKVAIHMFIIIVCTRPTAACHRQFTFIQPRLETFLWCVFLPLENYSDWKTEAN